MVIYTPCHDVHLILREAIYSSVMFFLGRFLLTLDSTFSTHQIYAPNWIQMVFTLPETNIAPKNGWLEYYFPIGKAYFQVRLLLVSGRVTRTSCWPVFE